MVPSVPCDLAVRGIGDPGVSPRPQLTRREALCQISRRAGGRCPGGGVAAECQCGVVLCVTPGAAAASVAQRTDSDLPVPVPCRPCLNPPLCAHRCSGLLSSRPSIRFIPRNIALARLAGSNFKTIRTRFLASSRPPIRQSHGRFNHTLRFHQFENPQ
jgi:hypothetical protein